MLQHLLGMFIHPHKEWDNLNQGITSHNHNFIWHLLVLAAIPGFASYFGATQVGWSLTGLDPVLLTHDSALVMSLLSWLAIIGAVLTMAVFTHWMGKTYGCKASWERCIVFASYTATPLYLCGLLALYPSLPLSLLGILAGIGYATYLLFIGMPHIMGISFERGFMFASSLVCAGLVVLVCMKVASSLMWQMGAGPVFQ